MKKKSSRNPYFSYMMHFQKQERKQGRHFEFSDLALAASESWNAMTTEQREPFKKKSKTDENRTSQGIPISQIRKEQQEAVEAEKVMKKTIRDIVTNSFINNTVGSQEYHFVDGNYFVETQNKFCPAEIAMVKFTFEDGVAKKFHTYANPGDIPNGYRYYADEHSEKTHQLPRPPNAMGEKNYKEIFHKITMFLGNASELPPLYIMGDKNMPMILSFLNQFCDSAETDFKFRVYPLQQLYLVLKEEAAKNSIDDRSVFQSIHVAARELVADQFAFLKTACSYHEQQDCRNYCALSNVQKWAFTFAANICSDLNIPLIAGQQLPAEVEIK